MEKKKKGDLRISWRSNKHLQWTEEDSESLQVTKSQREFYAKERNRPEEHEQERAASATNAVTLTKYARYWER